MTRTLGRGAVVAVAALTLTGCAARAPHSSGAPVSTPKVTAAVRAGLLAASAASHGLPVADFTGLATGTTYYAYDRTTSRYYAAAGLVASAASLRAQVSTQDDGAYDLFVKRAGGAWRVYNDGLGGAQDAICPIALPAAVLAAWHWHANSCYPPAG